MQAQAIKESIMVFVRQLGDCQADVFCFEHI